jgi:hypothetical protein
VRIQGLTKRFGRRVAVDQIDLEIPTGTIAGFIGPNGAGKTTTLAMLPGLVARPRERHSVRTLDLRSRLLLGRVGALIEAPAFYLSLTGRQNLKLLATIAGDDVRSVSGLLEQVGLGNRGEDRFRAYSTLRFDLDLGVLPQIRLYAASAATLLGKLQEVPDEVDSVMLVGHNPGIQDLALSLARTGSESAKVRSKFPTAALAALELIATWRELGPWSAELVSFAKPKVLSSCGTPLP